MDDVCYSLPGRMILPGREEAATMPDRYHTQLCKVITEWYYTFPLDLLRVSTLRIAIAETSTPGVFSYDLTFPELASERLNFLTHAHPADVQDASQAALVLRMFPWN